MVDIRTSYDVYIFSAWYTCSGASMETASNLVERGYLELHRRT